MTEFMAELDRYLPRLAAGVTAGRGDGAGHAAEPRGRGRRAPVPAVRGHARRLAAPLGGRCAPGSPPTATAESRAAGLRDRHPGRRLGRHRAAPPGHRGAAGRGEPLLPAPPPGRVGVQHAGRGRRLRADVGGVQLCPGAAPRRRARRRRADLQPRRLVGRARRGDLGHAVPARQGADARRPAARCRPTRRSRPSSRRRQAAERAAERDAAQRLLRLGRARAGARRAPRRGCCCACSPWPPRPARSWPGGSLATAAGGNDVLTMRLVPDRKAGSAVRTQHGVLHLPVASELPACEPAGRAAPAP